MWVTTTLSLVCVRKGGRAKSVLALSLSTDLVLLDKQIRPFNKIYGIKLLCPIIRRVLLIARCVRLWSPLSVPRLPADWLPTLQQLTFSKNNILFLSCDSLDVALHLYNRLLSDIYADWDSLCAHCRLHISHLISITPPLFFWRLVSTQFTDVDLSTTNGLYKP